VNEVQNEIKCLNYKLDLLNDQLREVPKVEQKRVFLTLEDKLTNVMRRVTLL
jgi:hypothetical protein